MSLETRLYLVCANGCDPTPTKRGVLDALMARFPEADQRRRLERSGALDSALQDLHWLYREGGAETLLPVRLTPTVVSIRRPNEAPLYVTPLDVLRRYVYLGWVGEHDRATLPPEALTPPQEAPLIPLDAFLAKYFQVGGHPAPTGEPAADTLRTRGKDFVAELEAYCEAYRRRVGSN
jgi:hypothetical protein